jgi:SAM-dependent MidA family methyltransferase
MQLTEIIIQKIKKEGAVSFHDFMEMALYYPGLGYYTSPCNRIGKTGDYYTSPVLSQAFGAMIGKQLEQMWEILGSTDFTVVEYGANTGILCNDIISYLKNNKRLYNRLNYCIIEKNPALQENLKKHLDEKVRWHHSIADIPECEGCVLSNELVDNFSVHQVVMQKELMEVFVDYQDGFIELLKPARKALIDYMTELKVSLPEGSRAEINLNATEWIKEIATSLKKGYVITIDYGCHSNDLYNKRRSCGTLLCYHKHSINDNPYINIGTQDITSHVNFSALCHWGFKNGLECCGLSNQANFLLALGFNNYLREILNDGTDLLANAKKESVLKHTFLIEMGSKYKVLIQRKGMLHKPLLGLELMPKL